MSWYLFFFYAPFNYGIILIISSPDFKKNSTPWLYMFDFRDSEGRAKNWAIAAANGIVNLRDFYYNPSTMPRNMRGNKRARASKPNMFARIRAANAVRLAKFRANRLARTRPASRFTSRPYSGYRRKKFTPRRGYAGFSSKGIIVHQKNSYLLDIQKTKEGFDTAVSYFTGYWNPNLDSGVSAPLPIPIGTPGITENYYVYGRLMCQISQFISSTNMSSQFTKVKVNSITHTFNFPDQAAATSNDKWPLIIWVNHGDKWRVNIDSYGDGTAWATADQLLERPGWKKFYVKRMNQLKISYKPTMLRTIESNVAGTAYDAQKLISMPYLDLDDAGVQSSYLIGPTVCFQMPDSFIPVDGASNVYYQNAFDSVPTVGNAMSSFLEYSTVTVSANVAFKDPDNEAVRGC